MFNILIVLSSANYNGFRVLSIDILLLFYIYYKCFIWLNGACPSCYRIFFSLEPKPRMVYNQAQVL